MVDMLGERRHRLDALCSVTRATAARLASPATRVAEHATGKRGMDETVAGELRV